MADRKSQDRGTDSRRNRDAEKQGIADPKKGRVSQAPGKARGPQKDKAASDALADDRFQATDN